MTDTPDPPEDSDPGNAPTVSLSEVPTGGVGTPATAALPDRIGRYKILGVLGEGGMGVVYEAEQPDPRRVVALKVIRGGAFVDDTRLRMFQREVDTLARLKHPNIAAIYESGRTDDGQHFFAMELVQGETLARHLRGRPKVVTPEELRRRLFLFRQIAQAVHYAHQRGVIHRDLKPANIVITQEATSQDLHVSGVVVAAVKILDFGLARITEADAAATMTTEVGAIKGTLPYMSPEQARGRPEAIDIRTDVYALGVVLYEMLTGKLPYDVMKGGVPEALRVICEENPEPPSRAWTGARRLDPDVETILGKALEKEADRRYQSAAELAADVDRYLASKPIEARPPSTIYQLRKFARRNRVLVGGVVATFVVLVAGIVTSEVQRREAVAQRTEAVAQRQASEASRLLMLGEKEIEVDPTRALAYAIGSLERADSAEARRFALDALWRGPSYFRLAWEGFQGTAGASFSPDGEWLAIQDADGANAGRVALWRPGGDGPRFLGPAEDYAKGFPKWLIFSPRSDALFVGGASDTAVRRWSVETGELIRSFTYDTPESRGHWGHEPLWVSSDGDRLISVAYGSPPGGQPARFHLLSWSQDDGEPEVLGSVVASDLFPRPVIDPTGSEVAYEVNGVIFVRSLERSVWGPAERFAGHEGEINRPAAFSGDGRHLVSLGTEGTVRVYAARTPTDEPLHVIDTQGMTRHLGFDPSGTFLASSHDGGWLNLWSLDAPAAVPPLELLQEERELIQSVAFHPDGRWLAATGVGHTMVWPRGRPYPRVLLREDGGQNFHYRGFSFSPDGTWVAASVFGSLRRIPLTRSAGDAVVRFAEDVERAIYVVFDPAGRYLLAGGDRGAYFVPLQGGAPRELFPGRTSALAISHDGRMVASRSNLTDESGQTRSILRIWDVETWEHRDFPIWCTDIEFTKDGSMLLAGATNLYRWDMTDREPELLAEGITARWADRGGRIDLSPDGRYVLGADEGRAMVRDLEEGVTRVMETHQGAHYWVFDPTGTIVVSGGQDGIVRVGRASGEEPHWLIGHQGMVNDVAVSPDGRWILSSGADGTLRLWPMPDLDRPPLHALPLDELLELLRAQTNLRVVPDPESTTGYRITWDNPDFKSWDEVPTW